MIRPTLRGLAGLALLLGGCYASPAPAPRVEADEARLAAEALAARDYVKATELYRQALEKAPDSLPLHYGLGVAASYLDLKPEAVREFNWVLERGKAGQAEVENARDWLIRVGALAPPARRATVASEPVSAWDAPPKTGTASVEGRAVFSEGPQQEPMKRMQVFLIEQPNRVNYYRCRTDEDGHFHFSNVEPGLYKLSDRVVGPPKWRLRVEVKPGQVVLVDLGPGNSTKVRDDFSGEP